MTPATRVAYAWASALNITTGTKEPLIKSIGDSASLEGLAGKARIAGNGLGRTRIALAKIRNAVRKAFKACPKGLSLKYGLGVERS